VQNVEYIVRHWYGGRVQGDPIAVLDAAYDVDASARLWLRRLVEAVQPLLGAGLGALGYTWDARGEKVEVRAYASSDCPIPAALGRRLVAVATANYVRGWLAMPFGTASSIPGWDAPRQREIRTMLSAYGCHDVLSLNAKARERRGCIVAFPLRASIRLPERDRAHWARIAAHIAVGYRLRARLAEARELAPKVRARQGPESLSDREREVLTLAAMQRSNKLIAYELGLSDSTVRVLLTRACRKLGARSRAEAIERWRGFTV
jgi:DNA-binding CsgD family transcriptional regulator